MTETHLARPPPHRRELFREEVGRRPVVAIRAGVLGEVRAYMRAGVYLFTKEVDLVEEKDEGRLGEPLALGDGREEHERFLHLVAGLILEQDVVVAAYGDEEKDGLDVVKLFVYAV